MDEHDACVYDHDEQRQEWTAAPSAIELEGVSSSSSGGRRAADWRVKSGRRREKREGQRERGEADEDGGGKGRRSE